MANDEIDPNKIAADFLSTQIESVAEKGTAIGKTAFESLKVRLRASYKDYIDALTKRFGKTRSFFIRDEPVPLYDFFVPLNLVCQSIIFPSACLNDILKISRYAIVCGTGGSGKSILLKHFLLNALSYNKKIPVFLELRDLNDTQGSSIDHFRTNLRSFQLDFDESTIVKALKLGKFILLLDGFDEVYARRRKQLLDEIEAISTRYPENQIILTTRPDLRISDLDLFYNFKTLPLDRQQSLELVSKLPAEDSTKQKFIEALKGSLYDKHKSFLSNPLLLSIMLLTYGYNAEIPNKLSIFYNQAYEALFQRHDAYKGAFRREKASHLDIQDFARVFSTFCLRSYDERRFQFTEADALSILRDAKDITHISFSESAYLEDLRQSVCLLIEDGLFFVFSHRSFQEHFTARFIVDSDGDTKRRLLRRFKAYIAEDTVYRLVHEMEPEFVEFHVILPFICETLDSIGYKRTIGITHYQRFIRRMFTRFEIEGGHLKGFINDSEFSSMLHFCLETAAYLIEWDGKYEGGLSAVWQEKEAATREDPSHKEVFKTSELKLNSPLLRELYTNGRFFSRQPLDRLVQIKVAIEKKRELSTGTLDRLIFKRPQPRRGRR